MMTPPAQKPDRVPPRRRYLVHLCSLRDEGCLGRRYVAHIQLWTTRSSAKAKAQTRIFADEYELIETINPLLPQGSDVRNVISHIENPEGFLYLLRLNSDQASGLGWQDRLRL